MAIVMIQGMIYVAIAIFAHWYLLPAIGVRDVQHLHAVLRGNAHLWIYRLPSGVAKLAWTLVNDVYMVEDCMKFPNFVLAAGAIYVAANVLEVCVYQDVFERKIDMRYI